jgi:hypothetical protein
MKKGPDDRTVQTHEVGIRKRPVGKMTRFLFLPNSAKLTSVVRQSGKSRMTILDFTEQNHVVLDFSGNVRHATHTLD